MNNQFSDPDAWGDYLTALEHATPVIEAIAVTDESVTDTYEEVPINPMSGSSTQTPITRAKPNLFG